MYFHNFSAYLVVDANIFLINEQGERFFFKVVLAKSDHYYNEIKSIAKKSNRIKFKFAIKYDNCTRK